MKERLRVYVQGLFRGAALTIQNAELKEEILQNTLEHYDDLLAEGKIRQGICASGGAQIFLDIGDYTV